ncbi:MAG: dihydroorotate dehydrogenase-like protein [Spirochaetales bacterium]|nr:dihydroorotate dehydrogenase-like protein [Spirochaetales bacterium]
MPDLSVSYMGLKLKNPVIVSSSSLTQTLDGVKRCVDGGASAVVLKSLFEEQIGSETLELEELSGLYAHPEALDYVRQMGMRLGPRDYLKLIEDAKKALDISVIASLNCISPKWWSHYAKDIETAGADALELNIAVMPKMRGESSEKVEKLYVSIVNGIRKDINLPIAVKIGPYFTVLTGVAEKLKEAGADALVLFNRFYQLDIDINNLTLKPGYRFSSPAEINLPLRWAAILYDQIGCDMSASTGVHDGDGAVKMLLAGVNAVQVCSTLYLNGIEQIAKILERIENWMKEKNFAKIDDFRGKMSQVESKEPEYYERLQYIKALVGIE